MFKAGFAVGTNLSALLIYRFGYLRKSGSAVKVVHLLPDEQRSTSAYTALMGAYFSCGKAEKGVETFNKMRLNGICVALGTCNMLLAGLEKNGRVKKDAELLTMTNTLWPDVKDDLAKQKFKKNGWNAHGAILYCMHKQAVAISNPRSTSVKSTPFANG
ncbi:hypothetical protein LguiA_006203 [Lonicera macranthoides]